MTHLVHFTLAAILVVSPGAIVNTTGHQTRQERRIEINHNLDTDTITARLISFQVSGEKLQYHSLRLGAAYNANLKTNQKDTNIMLELVSVVKARKLNSDLYVVFDVDGREIHFGSNRSAIRKPVPGRVWIGERMVFSIPLEEFQRLATAQKLAIKMGSVRFDLDEDARGALKVYAETIQKLGS